MRRWKYSQKKFSPFPLYIPLLSGKNLSFLSLLPSLIFSSSSFSLSLSPSLFKNYYSLFASLFKMPCCCVAAFLILPIIIIIPLFLPTPLTSHHSPISFNLIGLFCLKPRFTWLLRLLLLILHQHPTLPISLSPAYTVIDFFLSSVVVWFTVKWRFSGCLIVLLPLNYCVK